MRNNEFALKAQAATAPKASRHRVGWTQHEIAQLEDRTMRDAQLAEKLGRTYYAITTARHLLATGASLGGGQESATAAASRRRRASEAIGYDYVTTFPPGYND